MSLTTPVPAHLPHIMVARRLEIASFEMVRVWLVRPSQCPIEINVYPTMDAGIYWSEADRCAYELNRDVYLDEIPAQTRYGQWVNDRAEDARREYQRWVVQQRRTMDRINDLAASYRAEHPQEEEGVLSASMIGHEIDPASNVPPVWRVQR